MSGTSTVSETLEARGRAYGDFGRMARMAQRLKDLMRSDADDWLKLNPCERESLEIIATKVARILCGKHNQQDSWHDIQGYAKLAEDSVEDATD